MTRLTEDEIAAKAARNRAAWSDNSNFTGGNLVKADSVFKFVEAPKYIVAKVTPGGHVQKFKEGGRLPPPLTPQSTK